MFLRAEARDYFARRLIDRTTRARYPSHHESRRSQTEPQAADKPRPRMTRELAEARAVGGGKGKFDWVAFLRTLKK